MDNLMNYFGSKKDSDRLATDVIENPFSKEYISDIYLHAFRVCNKVKVMGSVEFTNGNTKGKQDFQADTLPELFIKIYKFCNEL